MRCGIIGLTATSHAAIKHTSDMIQDGTIVDADISPTAAISKSKLALTAAITDEDIAPNAAIAKSKLALTGMITDEDIAPNAAIAKSKLALTGAITNDDIAPNAAIAKSKLALAGTITDEDIAPNAAIAQSKLALTADPGSHASRHAVGGADSIILPLDIRAIPNVLIRFRYLRGDIGVTGSSEDFLALPAGRTFKLWGFFFAGSGELPNQTMAVRYGTTSIYSVTLNAAPWYVFNRGAPLASRTTTGVEIFNIFFQSGWAGTASYTGFIIYTVE